MFTFSWLTIICTLLLLWYLVSQTLVPGKKGESIQKELLIHVHVIEDCSRDGSTKMYTNKWYHAYSYMVHPYPCSTAHTSRDTMLCTARSILLCKKKHRKVPCKCEYPYHSCYSVRMHKRWFTKVICFVCLSSATTTITRFEIWAGELIFYAFKMIKIIKKLASVSFK